MSETQVRGERGGAVILMLWRLLCFFCGGAVGYAVMWWALEALEGYEAVEEAGDGNEE